MMDPRDQEPAEQKISRAGWGVVVCSLLLGLSAFPELRLELGGLYVQPINLAVLVLLLGSFQRLNTLPPWILLAFIYFIVIFSLAAMFEPGGLSPVTKLTASIATIATIGLAIRNPVDFRAAAVAALISAAVISVRGLSLGDLEAVVGINPMVGIANKNAFSLYVLPPILVGGYILILDTPKGLQRVSIIVCILIVALALFSTANRSGWLGVIAIAMALAFKALARARRVLIIAAVALCAVMLVENFGNTRVIEAHVAKTREGNASDAYRAWIVRTSFEIGLEHPFLGVSPQRLPEHIGRSSPDGFAPAAHNVFALIFGGGGFMLATAFILVGLALWSRPAFSPASEPGEARNAHYLLRAMLLLWCLRGLFSDEILYSQSFSLGLGLCIGLCRIHGVWRNDL